MRQLTIGTALLLLVLAACSDDDYHYPDLVTELAEIVLDEEGLATQLITDAGNTYNIADYAQYSNVADTTLRCYCRYVDDDGEITLYTLSVSEVFCTQPALYEDQPMDILHVTSAWATKRYLNLYIAAATGSEVSHALGFNIDSISQDSATLTRTAHHTLLHQASSDADDYTTRHYVSFPLFYYSGLCDTVTLSVYTDEGLKTYTAPVP